MAAPRARTRNESRPQQDLRLPIAPFVGPNNGENIVAGNHPLDYLVPAHAAAQWPVLLYEPTSLGRIASPGHPGAGISDTLTPPNPQGPIDQGNVRVVTLNWTPFVGPRDVGFKV